LLQRLLQRRGLALLLVGQVAHLRGEPARKRLDLAPQARLEFLEPLGSHVARCHAALHLRQFQCDASFHGLPHGFDDLAELGRQGFVQRRQLLIYFGNLRGAGLLGRHDVVANLGFDLLNGFFNGVGLRGRVRVHGLQVQGDLGVYLSQAPVHLPDVLGETGFQRHNHLLQYAPVQALAELHQGVFVDRLCVLFHFSQPFRQGTKVGHFILPGFGGSLCEFHRHAEQEAVAKRQREALEERGLTGLLHKT
jgi:hypothetical protein